MFTMTGPQNVKWVVKNKLCISCGMCDTACPRVAIKMTRRESDGAIFPTINETICTRCGVCLTVCYGFNVEHQLNLRVFHSLPNSFLGNCISFFTGFSNDKEIHFNSTSGGIVPSLLIHALSEKLVDSVIVTKMQSGNPPQAKAFIATTTQEILAAVGSKYCPVSLAECLATIDPSKRYAVVGLPCHIYGMRKLAEANSKVKNSIVLYIGLICGGMPAYLGTEYLLSIHNMKNQYVKLEYRGGGWPGRLLIQNRSSDQQKTVSVSYPEYWQNLFGYFLPYRCTLCHDGFNEFSDISCGDVWLPRFTNNDKEGTSLIITRTEKGDRLVHDAFEKRCIQIVAIDGIEAIKSQQGIVQFKNLTLKSRMTLSKICQKKLPSFDLSRTPAASFNNYLVAIDLYLGSTMASRKDLWWLLNIYVLSKRTIGKYRKWIENTIN